MNAAIEGQIARLKKRSPHHPQRVIHHHIAPAQGHVQARRLEGVPQVLVHDQHMIYKSVGHPVGGARAGVGLEIGPIGRIGRNIPAQPVEGAREKIAHQQRAARIAQIHVHVAKINRRRPAQKVGRIHLDKAVRPHPQIRHVIGLAGVDFNPPRLVGDVRHPRLAVPQNSGRVIEQPIRLFRIPAHLRAIERIGHRHGDA